MRERCPVCDGQGWWDYETGELLKQKPAFSRRRVQRCFLCDGDGRVELKDVRP